MVPPTRFRLASSTYGSALSIWSHCSHCTQIGSIEGLQVPFHETYAYSASKAGLHHLSRHLAGRLGWEGITSNTIACGPFETKSKRHIYRLMPLADRFGRFNVTIITSFVCSATTLALWLPSQSNQAAILAYTVIFGFWSVSAISLAPVCVAQISKTEDFINFMVRPTLWLV